jgi:hypothetical protein
LNLLNLEFGIWNLELTLPARLYLIICPLLALPSLTQAQEPCCIIQGTVYDATSGTTLTGAGIHISGTSKGTTTDSLGRYSFRVDPGIHTLVFSFIGFQSDTLTIDPQQQVTHSIRLKPAVTTIQEITVSGQNAREKITQTETGLISITRKDIDRLPYLLGEVDPIRIIQLMPGIQTAGEGSTGFYVRGGALDQNLMMLDHATIYNPSHMFGFFSVFNGSTIRNIDVYKSGIPAYHGGRLSSVTRVTTRTGNNQQLKGEGSLGLIAANVLVEGPIKKNKGSFLIAARRTYIDLFAKGLRELSILKQDIDYHFYDLNANFDYPLSPRDQLSFRGYLGKDHFVYNAGNDFSNRIEWKNTAASLSWKHTSANGLFSELALHTSLYDMSFGAAINTYNFAIASDIHDRGLTWQFNLQRGRHDLVWGAVYTDHSVRPNNISGSSADVDLNLNPPVKLHADEGALFINDKIRFGDRLEISAGIRTSAYRHRGGFTRYMEDENFQVLDTITYASGKTIKTYANLEPRVAARFSLAENASIKASYDRTAQYMHMAPLSSVSLPLDIWVPSSSVIQPQTANQYSAGYYRNFEKPKLESAVVLYYKTMDRQIEYREGMIIGYSKGYNFDDNFVFGKGASYGAEFSVKKSTGRLNGQVSYTLAKTTRTFPALNKGISFPAKYDRRHDLSIIANFEYSSRWTFSSVFVFSTGNVLNLPIARYVIQGNVVNEYGSRNSFRMPAYHRLDLAATYIVRKTNRFEASWVFSVYNAYNRRNPYYMYFETEGDLKKYELKTSIKQVSLFPVLPAVTYRLKF